MWNELAARPVRYAGAAGTVTFANACKLLSIWAHASSAGSVAFTDGTLTGTVTVPLAAGVFQYDPKHLGTTIKAGGTIVFTGTDGYLVEVMP